MSEHALRALKLVKEKSGGVKILVVGDVMLDRFLYGSVERISPEAPVPVVDVDREVSRPGGASNVVLNLLALGAKASLVGVVGSDRYADELSSLLKNSGLSGENLVADPSRTTSVKTRVIAQHQQMVRFDREDRSPLSHKITGELCGHIAEAARSAQAVIISDYGKTVVRPEVMEAVAKTGLSAAVDPKPQNAAFYKGAAVITPNTRETELLSGIRPSTDEAAHRAGLALMEKLSVRSVLVTRGEKGMTLVGEEGAAHHIPTKSRDVFDVTGAGDTSISVYTLALAVGATPVEAASLANLAGGIVVGKLGTATVTVAELEKTLENDRRELHK